MTALAGDKVRLRPLRDEDAAAYLDALHVDGGADEVFRFLGKGGPPATIEAARHEVRAALAARARGERLAYAQLDAVTGEFIGTTSFYDVNPSARTLAIGHTWLGRRWWRTGHNTESKLLLLGHAFDTLQAARVVWHTDIRNERSQAAIQRLGARHEGLLRNHRIRADGTWRDTMQYAMTDTDWPGSRARLQAALTAGHAPGKPGRPS